MFIQLQDGVPYSEWLLQDVGRVALSGFSAGMDFVIRVMNNVGDGGSSPPNPAGLGKDFFDKHLTEVYDFDGNPAVGTFLATVDAAWRRGSADRAFLVYHEGDGWLGTFGSIGGATTIRYNAFHDTIEGEAHYRATYGELFELAKQRTKNEHAAEDAVQAAFLHVLDSALRAPSVSKSQLARWLKTTVIGVSVRRAPG